MKTASTKKSSGAAHGGKSDGKSRPSMTNPGAIVISAGAMRQLLKELRNPPKPTEALRNLMAGRFDLVPG